MCRHVSRRCLTIGSRVLRFAGFLVAACFASATLSYGYATYSDATLRGTSVVAWGVTDVTNYQYEPWAEVQVSLTSPRGRRAYSSNVLSLNSARAEISLSGVKNDTGTYTVRSWHTAICSEMGTFIDDVTSYATIRISILRNVHYRYLAHTSLGAKYTRCDPKQFKCKIMYRDIRLPIHNYLKMDLLVATTPPISLCRSINTNPVDRCGRP